MRVLLVNPPMILHQSDIPQFGHPIGLAYLGAVLREHGHQVSILDTVIRNPKGHQKGELLHIGMYGQSIQKEVSAYEPQVVGISSMFTSQANSVHRLAKLIKDRDKNMITIVGGAHPSALPQEMLQDKNVDFIVLGEGEETVVELLQCLSNSQEPEEVYGIGYRKNGQQVTRPRHNTIKNLDELPFPAWDMLEMDKYAKHHSGYGPVVKNTPFFSISTSRGCPLHCMFCTVPSIWGHNWRGRSPQSAVDEIEILNKKYGIEEIYFVDDNLLWDRKRLAEICDELVRRKIEVSWATPNGVNINFVEHDLLHKMRRSGCFLLCFGIESGNEYIRDKVVRKRILVPHAKEVVKWCRELNIWTSGCFIIGLPGENEKTFRETIQFSQGLDMDSSSFFVSRLMPGTELWKLCEEKGYVDKNPDALSLTTAHTIKTEDFTPQDLEIWRRKAYRAYAVHVLKREILRFNLIKRLLKIRSLADIRLLFRIAAGSWKRLV